MVSWMDFLTSAVFILGCAAPLGFACPIEKIWRTAPVRAHFSARDSGPLDAMRAYWQLLSLFAVLLPSTGAAAGPHVLMIVVDDLGWNGAPAHTQQQTHLHGS